MLKIWGRNTSSNVQKVMWAVGELKLEHQRIDIGGKFGRNNEAAYLALNPNCLVPTLQDGDLTVWESNTIVRYLAGRYGGGTLEPSGWRERALASQWMDWQLSVVGPAI
jgi:glutathione S-transferase